MIVLICTTFKQCYLWGIFMPHTSSIVCLHIVFLILSK
ncbi:hypothetical protein PRO82_002187, partial [Candidatus Protochlamydia amoebophila]|nr:hypothetical protein [Candidatus Protochlamydia amoebophila]